jgi:ligand-binding SRPBCC domain-containing protein
LTSRIVLVKAPVSFVDEQVRGPFRSFRREHRFEAVTGATVMTDHWEHVAPFGPLGRLVDRLILERHMRGLLETRNQVLKDEAEALVRGQVTGSGTNGARAVATATNSGEP